jgi:plasmid stability protein
MTLVATLHVRNVPTEVYEALRDRASDHGRSINAEVVEILRKTLGRPDVHEVLEGMRRLAERINLPPDAPTPEQIIREARDRG